MNRTTEDIDTTSLTRRAVMAAIMAIVLLLGGVRTGSATLEWCRVDPVVTIDGITYNIILASPTAILESATGPTEVVITVPAGTSYALVSTDPGFGYGETVEFVEARGKRVAAGSFEVAVRVPASERLPVVVEVIGLGGTVSTDGQTNKVISLTVTG
ncbi:MAG: hypothetical protein H0U40_10600 [Chloroflexia bacterium]|nr:hypothetical protein [Chloroflexia bacterium]MDQ3514080.1 hypothetical protein [Chloroflexota bacterium]